MPSAEPTDPDLSGEPGIAIAGAGIAGLTAAIALARRGIRSTIFEQAETLSAAGAGIQLGPNATRLLIRLGLEAPLRAASAEPAGLTLRDGVGTGRALARITLGQAARVRYGAPYVTLHRAGLQAMLREAAEASDLIALRLGQQVTSWAPRNSGAGISLTVMTAGKQQTISGPFAGLVAADGIWSGLRAKILGGAEASSNALKFTGKFASRAVLDPASLPPGIDPDTVKLWLLPHAHVVHYPAGRDGRVNVVVVHDANGDDRAKLEESALNVRAAWNGERKASDVTGALRNAASALRSLVAVPDTWRSWPLCTLAPLSTWQRAGAVLIGDAAHPVLPYLAQGAGLAIEDACVLAKLLAPDGERPKFAAAAEDFQTLRQARAKRLQAAGERNGRIYHLKGTARLVRNAVLTASPERALMAPYGWIYGHDAEEGV